MPDQLPPPEYLAVVVSTPPLRQTLPTQNREDPVLDGHNYRAEYPAPLTLRLGGLPIRQVHN